jgi:hypothetical protein
MTHPVPESLPALFAPSEAAAARCAAKFFTAGIASSPTCSRGVQE